MRFPRSVRSDTWFLVAAVSLGLLAPLRVGAAKEQGRFFVMGSGILKLRSLKNDETFVGRYRRGARGYREKALAQISRVFDAATGAAGERVSLRLLEVLAHLRDALGGGWIVLNSGYRSPAYNQRLRDMGRTVAKASLHQYGMAADFRLAGVPTLKVWRYARAHKLGGVGYYNSPQMHIDVGPARSWTQSTANVRRGVSLHNKRVMLVAEYDRYWPGETMRLNFARMTAYPIGVRPRLAMERKYAKGWKSVHKARWVADGVSSKGACGKFNSIAEMAWWRWDLPADTAKGRYRLRVDFCEVDWPAMPRSITSREFVIGAPLDRGGAASAAGNASGPARPRPRGPARPRTP